MYRSTEEGESEIKKGKRGGRFKAQKELARDVAEQLALLPGTILEDREKLCRMVREMYPELPEPKAKKSEKRRRSKDGI